MSHRLFKKYHCYHVFVIAVNERKITVPCQFKNAEIGQNPKVGGKPKVKKEKRTKFLKHFLIKKM